eukprot:GHUV01004409.1.p1 GENE.GHUV01004409.1~~GHUV01004409.1.p1  ORF type:complete len:173 (+),score=26.78 GHUV01004409.1:150-668(+)
MLATCSTSAAVSLPSSLSCCCPRPAPRCTRRRLAPIHAGNDQNTDANTSSSATVSEDEARIEALEGQLKKGKGQRAARQIPIRGVTPKQQPSSVSTRAEWKEGKLFPEGWEQMDAFEKVSELYLGQRGLLFWANKVAYASVFVVVGAWVLFRFVGPALGLYKLQGDLTPPPL